MFLAILMMRHTPLALTFLFVFFTSAWSQQVSNKIDLHDPDLKKLERLTYDSVNALRENKKMEKLRWDDVLYRAAKDQADFLTRQEKISHFQNTRGKRTPDARVKIHGGLIYSATGENIVQIQLGASVSVKGKKLSTETYNTSAKYMAELWKASPGHYKNIVSKNYNCTALAVSYDETAHKLIAVQVFGFSDDPASPSDLPDYSDQLMTVDIPALPYKLKKNKGDNPKNMKAANNFLNLKVDRGYLTGSFKEAKKIFSGRKSGISQEFIPLSQFDSSSITFVGVPNRRNGLYELNGDLSEPVYRHELLRFSRKNTRRGYLIRTRFFRIKKHTRQFIYPLQGNDPGTESNLFLIRNKQLVIFKSYVRVPGDLFDLPDPSLPFTNSFVPANKKERYKTLYEYDTIALQVYYPSNQVVIDEDKQEEIKDAFNSVHGNIVSIEAQAYASIEGNRKDNERLAGERMKYFMLFSKPYLDSAGVQPEIITREQWDLFYRQIEEHNLDTLKDAAPETARVFINQHKNDSLISKLLDAQRYIRMRLIWRKEYKKPIPGKNSLQEYDSLKQLFDSTPRPSQKLINALERTLLNVYFDIAHSDVALQLPAVPVLEKYPAPQYHQLVFNYTVQHSITAEEFYDSLHWLTTSKYFPTRLKREAIYNNLVLIYQSYFKNALSGLLQMDYLGCHSYRQSELYLKNVKKLKCRDRGEKDWYSSDYFILKEIPSLIRIVKMEKVENFPVNDLWKYYYLYTIHSLYPYIPLREQEIYSLLPGFKKQFHPDNATLSDEERLTLAYFYCALDKYAIARELIKPAATREQPNKEALKLYLCLMYEVVNDNHEFSELLMREYPRLGKEAWCDLWQNSKYLNFLLFENFKLKKFYNCHCER